MPEIDILMATYNGEKYIEQQIESILLQSNKNWRLLIRDDCSKDNTPKIIKKYCKMYSGKIIQVDNNNKGLGAAQNFSCLLENSEAEYIMFSDQDDFWLEDKIELTYKLMVESEAKYRKSMPILVHSELKVVDKALKTISGSFWKHQLINPDNKAINRLLIQNNVTGCTVMINKALRDLQHPVPKDAIMHDWWIALVAATFGKIEYIYQPTILYRQHGNNDVGAKEWGPRLIIKKLLDSTSIKANIQKSIKQSEVFYNRYENKFDKDSAELVSEFAKLNKKNPLKKRLSILKYGFYKTGFIRNLGTFLFI